MHEENILEMTNITKTFPGVKALDSVSFSVKKGEVHALMGENGAGKSTLIKVLAGVYQKNEGTIYFDGKEINPKSVFDSGEIGISTVFQELNLIPYLSISENIFVGRYPKKAGKIDWKTMNAEATRMMEEIGIHVDVTKELSTQSTAMQQMVAIIRGVSMNAKLIILDEPTSSLDTKETQVLFTMMRKLLARGISMVFVSHRLDEIFEICDRITILKDGCYVGTEVIKDIDKLKLIRMMMGREVNQDVTCQHEYRLYEESEPYQCEFVDVAWKNKLRNINFGIHRGEVLGLAGLLGSGRTETVRLLFGCDRPTSGYIKYEGKKLNIKNTNVAVKNKIAFCTENRRVEGIVPNMSVEDNIALANLDNCTKALGWLDQKSKQEHADKYIDELRIKTPSRKQSIKNLSGGNQQKVILARWMNMNPNLIILDEPTRGIDVGAKAEIEKLIRDFAERGISVIMISSDLQEIVRNCDRVVVIRDGQSVGELAGTDISENNIMKVIATHEEAVEHGA